MDFNSRFNVIAARDFTPKCFKDHILWSEYYDYDELEDIVTWGIDKEFANTEILNKTLEGQHPYYTVPLEEFPPLRMRFFTKAKFVTKKGNELQGAIMNYGKLSVDIFLNDLESVTLSSHNSLTDLTLKSLKRISKVHNLTLEELTSLKFESIIPIDINKRIRGEFILEIDFEIEDLQDI